MYPFPDRQTHRLTPVGLYPVQGYIITRLNTGEAIGPLCPRQVDDYFLGLLDWNYAPSITQSTAA